MKLSVYYNEINRIGLFVQSKANELNQNIDELITLINSLANYWEGPDCNAFISKAISYLTSKKTEVNEIHKVGYVICKSSNRYGGKDVEWGNNVRKEGLSDES